MDLNRYKEIEGIEALKTLANEEAIYRNNWMWKVVDGRLKSKNINSKDWSYSTKDINDLICPSDEDESNYFVKKPFDIRKEMLTRPDEWVGAFKNSDKKWMVIGFDTSNFVVSVRNLRHSAHYLPSDGSNGGYVISKAMLEKCIPIEDVWKEDLL